MRTYLEMRRLIQIVLAVVGLYIADPVSTQTCLTQSSSHGKTKIINFIFNSIKS